MILNLTNEIDKKISEFYSEDIIANAKERVLEYFGINITSDLNTDFVFKIYYEHDYSLDQYGEANNAPLVNYLIDKSGISALGMVHDEFNKGRTRFDIRLMDRNNQNMEGVFGWLHNNLNFFDKYREEIMKISLMKSIRDENYKYASLYYIGFINKDDEINTLKCHWITKNDENKFDNEYYLDYMENTEIPVVQELIPILKSALMNCGGDILMLGIDYNKTAPQKHKIYIVAPSNPYDGLLKTFSNNTVISDRIRLIKDWAKVHQELFCAGFAIGKNDKEELTLNVYFQYKL